MKDKTGIFKRGLIGPKLCYPFGLLMVFLIATLLMFSCATWKYRGYYTLAYWTNQNFDTYQAIYLDASEEEKAFLKTYVAPSLNILKCVNVAIGAIEDQDDVKLREQIILIGRIGMGAGIATIKLTRALENGKIQQAINEGEILQTQTKLLLGVVK